jgi:hypothetical protein
MTEEQSTIAPDPDRIAWLRRRQGGIGSSDAPVLLLDPVEVFGKTPTALYLEKIATREPTDAACDSADFRRGCTYEPLAADLWEQQNPTLRVFRPRSPADRYRNYQLWAGDPPWLFADFDGMVVRPNGLWALEIKCPRGRGVRRIREEGVPPRTFVQAQHLALVLAQHRALPPAQSLLPLNILQSSLEVRGTILVIYDAEAVELLSFDCPNDAATQAEILRRGRDFWEQHIGPRIPPLYSAPPADLPALPQGTQAYTPVTGTAWTTLAEQFAAARQALRAAQMQAQQWQTALTQALEGAQLTRAWLPNTLKVIWQEESGGAHLDRAALQAAHPTLDLQPFLVPHAPKWVLRVYGERKEEE